MYVHLWNTHNDNIHTRTLVRSKVSMMYYVYVQYIHTHDFRPSQWMVIFDLMMMSGPHTLYSEAAQMKFIEEETSLKMHSSSVTEYPFESLIYNIWSRPLIEQFIAAICQFVTIRIARYLEQFDAQLRPKRVSFTIQ